MEQSLSATAPSLTRPTKTLNDSFVYSISDGNGGTDDATVLISVAAVNDAPVANNDNVTTLEDTAVTIEVLANDSDVDGDALQVNSALVSDPSDGTVTFSNGTFTYTPNANFNGTDSFVYSISDGNGGTADATVQISVTAVNDAPVAVNDNVTTSEDTALTISASELLTNDTDVDNDTLQVDSVSDPSNGSVVVNGDGTFTYTPNADFTGEDSFVYSISDGNEEPPTRPF